MEKKVIKSDEIKNYFINSLQEGRQDEIKICYMGHNSAWPYYQGLAEQFDDIVIDVFGSGTAYLGMFRKKVRDDYDVIILDGNGAFNEYEQNRLSQMAQSISKEKDKKVSIGYCFWVHDEKDRQCNHQEALIFTYENDKIVKNHFIGEDKQTVFWLLNIVMSTHDHLERFKVLKNSNKFNIN